MLASVSIESGISSEISVVAEFEAGNTLAGANAGVGVGGPSEPLAPPDGETAMKLTVFTHKNSWSRQDEKRFDSLAIKAALGALSHRERQELAILEDDRNEILSQRSPVEIHADLERSRLTRELMSALQNYVSFVGKDKKKAFGR